MLAIEVKRKKRIPSQSVENQPQKSKRQEGKEGKDTWMTDCGDQLFDVFSEIQMVNVLMEGGRFDSDFYQDQVDPSARKLVIETVRVRLEFVEAEKKLSDKKARSFARKLSALGQNKVVKEYCDDLPEISDEPDYESLHSRHPGRQLAAPPGLTY